MNSKNFKEIRWVKVVLAILGITPLALGITLYPAIPDLIPSHLGLDGTLTSHMSKSLFIAIVGSLPALITIVLLTAAKVDPLSKNYEQFMKSYYSMIIGIALFTNIMFYSALLFIIGVNFDVVNFMIVLTGLLVFYVGNFLPNIKRNYFCGFRTPWALNDDKNWAYTNRVGGKASMIGGVLIALIGGLKFEPVIAAALIVLVVSFMVMIPVKASYNFYKVNKEAAKAKPKKTAPAKKETAPVKKAPAKKTTTKKTTKTTTKKTTTKKK